MEFQGAQPLITFTLGLAAGVFADYKAHKWISGREREARTEERETRRAQQRNDFQRENLLEVQATLQNLARAVTEMYLHDLTQHKKHGQPWGQVPYQTS